jgi:hypothetical protein
MSADVTEALAALDDSGRATDQRGMTFGDAGDHVLFIPGRGWPSGFVRLGQGGRNPFLLHFLSGGQLYWHLSRGLVK